MTYPHTQADDNFDWNSGTYAGGAPAANADDFEFGEMVVVQDADALEAEAAQREFREPPVGTHEFFVKDFLRAPEAVLRTGYVPGPHGPQQVSWMAFKVGVRLALVNDPQASLLDWFDLPPSNPAELPYYYQAAKNADGKNGGFAARKLGHFLSRLGWPMPEGAPIPAEARKLGNWRNRRIVATVEAQKADPGRLDPTTGQPYPPRKQIKLFSYKASGATLAGPAMPAAQPQGPPARPQAQPPFAPPAPQPARPAAPPANHLAALRGQL